MGDFSGAVISWSPFLAEHRLLHLSLSLWSPQKGLLPAICSPFREGLVTGATFQLLIFVENEI